MENNTTTQTPSRPLLRRLDDWTLYAFNPTFPRHERALTDAIARQENRSTSMTDGGISRVLRRLDAWTLTVFNPRYPSDRRN